MVRLTILACIVVCAAPAAAIAATPNPSPSATASPTPKPLAQLVWRNLGPATSGGRSAAVVGSDRDPYLYYVGSAGGGVWKSTNSGQSWSPVFDETGVASIGAVALNPNDDNDVWVGTGEANPRNDVTAGNGVYHSSDGGVTWQHVLKLDSALVSRILVDRRDPRIVVVGVLGDAFADSVERGVYRTVDGGKTWTKTLYVGPQSGVSDLASSAREPNVIYAGVWQFRRTAWSVQSGGPLDALYRSSDGGATWTRLEGNGLPTDEQGRFGLAVASSNPNRVYALIQSKQGILWRSDDGGGSWKMVSDNSLINERPFYFSHVWVDPTNADRLWSDSVHLTVSEDGGKSFKSTADGVHGDHHAMWIAADGKRIIEGDDGGVAFSRDGGDSWEWRNNIPISQLYHVGFDNGRSYRVCAPLQDNGVWCAPSNPRNPNGISAAQWENVGGGDGTFVIPDPVDPNYVWLSSGGGNNGGELDLFDARTTEVRSISPYVRDQNATDPAALKYRFNWESPIAFDPFDLHLAYYGGNVLFATRDRGQTWTVMSPDLTRNNPEHQVVTGGITREGTGAETSETILYIEPSRLRRGEIWIGTDDGLVQLTRDGGKRWRDVTPPLARSTPWGRFASISVSRHFPGTAFAIYDRHLVGDRTPYIFVTHDYAAHWAQISQGLPADEEVRSVREDARNPRLIYAGLETSLWTSFDGGAHWRQLEMNLPPASMRDIQVQPTENDVLIATHGRGVWVLDDATPLQMLDRARQDPRGAYFFPIRTAYEWETADLWNLPADGPGPQYGAIVSFWLNKPALHNPTAEVVDAAGRVVRTFNTHEEEGDIKPDLTNQAGLNRFTWDLSEDPPVPWKFTPRWNAGFDGGAQVLPGTYTIRVHVDGRTLRQPVVVRADTRLLWNAAQLRARRDMLRLLFGDFARVDVALNDLSTIVNEAPLRAQALDAAGNGQLGAQVAQVGTTAHDILLTLTQNPANDQDDDFLTDVLRERLQAHIETFGGSFAPPTQAQIDETEALHSLANERLAAATAFMNSTVAALEVKLHSAGLPPLTTLTKRPTLYNPRGADYPAGRHHGDNM